MSGFMSSRFTFNRHVRDIEYNFNYNSNNSPHSNRSTNSATPQSKHTTPTSVSPHTHNLQSQSLKISLPTSQSQHQSNTNYNKRQRRESKELQKEANSNKLVAQQFSFLTVPSDSENNNLSLTSSPLISEPSPNPCPNPLILNTLGTNSKSTTSPEQPEHPLRTDSINTHRPIGLNPNISIELDLNRKDSDNEELVIEQEEEEINLEETVFSLSINTNYNCQNTFNSHHTYSSHSSYPINHSPVSTTSTVDNLTPLYTGILEAQTSLLPDLSLAPLDLVVSPTPIDTHLNILEIVNETPTHCNKRRQEEEKQVDTLRIIVDRDSPKPTLNKANKNYNSSSDSDYDFESDLISPNTSYQLLTDKELEKKLIKMGCCCSDPSDKLHKANTSSNDITQPMDLSQDDKKQNNIDKNQSPDIKTPSSSKKSKNGAYKDIGKGATNGTNGAGSGGNGTKLQIEITDADNNKRKRSFADKYFRSNEKVERRHQKKRDKNKAKNGTSPKNGKSSPNGGSQNDSNGEDYLPPIPNDASNNPSSFNSPSFGHQTKDNPNLSLLGPGTERSDTKTYGDENRDVVSPIPILDNQMRSLTNAKRPSTSALSSPLNSVRLSITPKGHLAPIYIHDPSSMSEEEDNSMSTTDSKDEHENTKYSEINTPVEFLKKHQTITKFVSSQQSQTSDKNVLSRRKRRPGVSERHTLTFSKPPIPAHELPQSPKFTEISLDVMKPTEFLLETLNGNLLFSGVDAEFAQKMVHKVVDLMKAAEFKTDEILMHQGAEGDAFYAVEKGCFDILVDNQGDEKKVAEASRGECVGEYALLYNQPRTATLKATEPSLVWGITAGQFAEMRQEIMDWNVDRFEKRQEFIHSIPLFQKLEQHELLNMTHACHAERYECDEWIIEPGAAAKKNTNVYIIMEGEVQIKYVTNEDNNYVQVEPMEHDMSSPIERVITDETGLNEQGMAIHLNLNGLSDDEQNEKKENQSYETSLKDKEKSPPLRFNLALQSLNSQKSDPKSDHNQSANGSSKGTPKELQSNNSKERPTPSKSNGNGKQMFAHPINNISDPPMALHIADPPILEDVDSNPQYIEPQLVLNLRSQDTDQTHGRDSGLGRPLELFPLNSINSVKSVHSIQIMDGTPYHGPQIDLAQCNGERELGRGEYFARNLFVNPYNEVEEEIESVKAHTPCKVLKVARDDFVLIMAQQAGSDDEYLLFHDQGIVTDGVLPDNKEWKHQRKDIQLEDLEEKDVLGIGSFGKVTLVQHKKSGEAYALKAVSKYRVVKTGQEEHIINEKRVLTMLDSPFCVKLFATFKTETSIYFLTELVLGGELFTVLRYNEKFDKNATRFYAGCVIMALEHLHSMDIIYRDLKPENLLLNSNGYLQLTDFGFAKKRNTTCTLCGTPQYLAPEVIHNWVQSFATDWWALGVLLYEMVVGHPPFEDDENIKMYEKILVHEPDFPKDINSKLRHLIQKLLEKNAYQRLGSGAGGARYVKAHPFFKNKLDWQELHDQKISPPYTPQVDDNFDTSNFDHFSDYEESSDDEDLENIDLNSSHFQWVENF